MVIPAKFSSENSLSPAVLLEQARDLLQHSEQLCQKRLATKRQNLASKIKCLKNKVRQRADQNATQKAEFERLKDFLNLKLYFDSRFKELESEYADLVLGICEKIIGQKISKAHLGLLNKVKEVTASISSRHNLIIHVNPCHLPHFVKELGKEKVIADSNLDCGNAKITLPTGEIFINWRNQLQTLISALKPEIV